MTTGVTIKKNLWPVIQANLALARGSFAAVGFPGDSAKSQEMREEGYTNVDIAIVHEFGTPPGVTPRIPSRPFMRQAFGPGTKRRDIQQAGQRLLGMIVEGKLSTKIALERLGTMGVTALKSEITQPGTAFAANSPATIARKKSSKPLIDTGALRAAVTYKVRMKGKAL